MLKKLLVAASVSVALALPAAAPAGAATLRWSAQNDITTLDPYSWQHSATSALLQHTYEALVRFGKDYKPEPALATSWEQLSPTQWRFKLRQNVKFHDGSPFTAEDVVFSFNRIKQPHGTKQVYVTGIKEVVKVDDYTVDFMLDKPVPLLLRNILQFFIMSKAWCVKNGAENIPDFKAKEMTYSVMHANGTGPYVVKEWVPDKQVVLTANPNWWDKIQGNVTDILYLPIKADATRVAALLSGDVDLVTELPAQDVAQLRENPATKVLDGIEIRTLFIGMDQDSSELKYASVKGKNPFKDIRVRHAMSLAVDRNALQKQVMRGMSIPAGMLVAPDVDGYDKELDKPQPADVAAAKKLLADAGYPNGFEFTLDCPNNRYVNDEQTCQAVIGMWARIGLKAKLNAMPFSTYSAKLQNRDTSAYMLGWIPSTFDAQNTLQSIVRTRTSGDDGNWNQGRISDPEIDALVDAMKSETDASKRLGMMKKALTLTRDRYYYVTLHHLMKPWGMRKNVTTLHRSNEWPESKYARVVE